MPSLPQCSIVRPAVLQVAVPELEDGHREQNEAPITHWEMVSDLL